MGIAHDTGVFQYSCTSPETMEAAAQLLRKGIDGSEIIEKTYFEKTYIQNQILGRALLESMLVLEKQVVVLLYPEKRWNFSRQFQAIWRESWLSFGRQKVWKWRFFCMRRTPGSISQSAFQGQSQCKQYCSVFWWRRSCACSRGYNERFCARCDQQSA